MRTHAWKPFVAVGLVLPPLVAVLSSRTAADVKGTMDFAAAVAVAFGVRWWRPRATWAWSLFAVGLTFGGASEWLQGRAGYGTALDLCVFASTVAVLLGLAFFIGDRTIGARGATLIDVAILFATALLLSWLFSFKPILDLHLTGLDSALALSSPLLDIVVFATGGALLFGPARLSRAYQLLACGFLVLLVGDGLMRATLLGGPASLARYAGAVSLAGAVFAGAAALHPSLAERQLRLRPERALTWRRILALAVALLAVPFALALDGLTHEHIDTFALAFGGGAIAVLALWRLLDLVGRHERLRHDAERSESRFRDLVEHLEPVVIEGLVGADAPLFVSRRAEDLLGYPLWRWLESNRFWAEHIHPDDRERVLARVKAAGETLSDYELEYRMLTADGRMVWIRCAARTRPDESGAGHRVSALLTDITEERQAQEKLERSLALFRATLDSTADGILVVDAGGKIAGYNRKFVEMWNIPESVLSTGDDSQAMAHVLDQLVDPETFVQKVQALYQDPVAESFDVVEFKDGRRFERYSKPQKISREAVGRVWSFRDVTVRKRAEEALRESERSFRETLENIRLVALALDTNGTVTFCNDYLLELTGWTRADLVGRRWFPLALGFDEALEQRFVLALQQGTLPMHSEQEIATKTGERRLISWNVTALRDPLGVPTGVVSIGEDVTEARHAEEVLRTSEERFRSLIENASDIITIVDRAGSVRYASPAIERLLGYKPEELIGQSIRELVHEEDTPTTRAWLTGLRDGSGDVVEVRVRDKTGDWRTLEAVGKLLADESGGREIVVNARDITERKQAEEALQRSEEQLRQAQKMEAVGRLAGGVAHDFNNLLTAISGYSEFLLGQLEPDSPLRHDAQEIQNAAERAAALTRQLLAFSRRQVLQPKVLDLNSVVAEVSRLLRRLIGEDVELSTEPAADLGQVRADPGQLEQVLVNLAVNARDAMPSGGKLTIATRNLFVPEALSCEGGEIEPGEYVVLSVTDTGSGIDSETRTHLFEPFFTTKEQGKGTGLGLATVFGIVKQSGGDILVDSEIGEGATFTMFLPRVDAPVVALPERVVRRKNGAAGGGGEGGSETVLLVEDEHMVRRLVRDVLERSGYAVLEAPDGPSALQLCTAHEGRIDLLLTDVVMPNMNGRELADQLVGRRPGLRVLFTSGYTDGEIQPGRSLREGVSFVGKPFSPDELTRKVREVLDNPAA